MSNSKSVLSIKETAELLGLSRGKTSELIRSGKIRSVKVGRRVLIPASAIDAFLNGEA